MAATAPALLPEGGPFQVWSEALRLQSTRATEFLDLTEHLTSFLERSRVLHGLLQVQTLHTTTGLFVNENEPLLVEDFTRLFESWAPCDAAYRHDDLGSRFGIPADERRNGHAHARALLLSTSVSLHVADGRLQLGTWQRVFLVELDGARRRSLSLLAMGCGA
jgi:secondary thiamine-phosphate synthase enzyme